jgi:GTP-binding protein
MRADTGEDLTAQETAAGEALSRLAWRFVRSAPDVAALPPPDRAEIAFAGRSNVGKSSLLNALLNRRALARTSNTPGRTQQLNFFEAPGVALFLVDMPGYGFARAPRGNVVQWTKLVRDYLRGRPTLVRVFLLVDARHGLGALDRQVMDLMDVAAVSYQVLLTKADKVKPAELARVVQATRTALGRHAAARPDVIATSSQTRIGLDAVRAEIARLAAIHRPAA